MYEKPADTSHFVRCLEDDAELCNIRTMLILLAQVGGNDEGREAGSRRQVSMRSELNGSATRIGSQISHVLNGVRRDNGMEPCSGAWQ
jgi:hypothetical protein